MTHDRRTQVRAVFLAAIMVISVVGMSVAFAGSAAAAATSVSVDTEQPVTGSSNIDITVGYDTTNDVVLAVDNNDDGTIQSGEVLEIFTPPTASPNGETRTILASPNVISNSLQDGSHRLIAYQESDADGTLETDGNSYDSQAEAETTLTFDTTQPSVGSSPVADPISGEVINTATPELEINLTDNQNIDPSTIEVSVDQSSREKTTLTNIQESGSFVTFDNNDNNVTVDFSSDSIPDLRDGSVTWDVTAKDEAGNSLSGSTSDSFTVDISGPTIDWTNTPDLDDGGDSGGVDPDKDELADPTTELEFDISDTGSGSLDSSSITASVSNASDGELYTLAGSGIVTYSSNTLTISPTNAKPIKGDVTVSISASDTGGNENTKSFSFTVDEEPLGVTDIQYSDGDDSQYTNADDGDEQFDITFNDTVEGTVTVGIDTDSDSSFEKTFSDTTSDPVDQTFSVDVPDITANYDNSSARVAVTSAQDNVENSLANSPSTTETTLDIDTTDPSISAKTPGSGDIPSNPVSGNIDIRDLFSPSSGDGETVTYEIKGDSEAASEYSEISGPATLESFTRPDGDYDIRATVTDDAGNTDDATYDITFENTVGTISVTDTPSAISGTVDLEEGSPTNVFDFSSLANDEEFTISYAEYDETEGTFGEYTDVGSDYTLDTTTLDDGLIKLRGTITGDKGTNSKTQITEVNNNPGDYDADPTETASDDGGVDAGPGDDITLANADGNEDVTVVVKADEDLSTLDVGVTNNHYFRDSTSNLTLDDFTPTQKSGDDVRYVATATTDYDGEYTAEINNAVDDDDGTTAGEESTSDTAIVDGEAPSIEDPDLTDDTALTNSDGSSTEVRVGFNEPVTGISSSSSAPHDLTFNGSASVTNVDASTASQGYVVVTLGSETQTGGDESIIANTTYTENHGDSTDNGDNADDVGDVDFGLDLSSGLNVVSIPAETGAVDLEAIDQKLQDKGITNIVTYESGADTRFPNYVPGGQDSATDITEMTGGNGYLISADQDTELDVEVENVPASGDGVVSRTEGLDPGWNLVGAFQEGSQPVSQAFATVNTDYQVEKGYTGDTVETVEPGQGYWTLVTAPSAISAVDYDGLNSDRPTVAAVDMTNFGGDDTSNLDDGETVSIDADVGDDSLVDSVTVDAPNLGINGVTLEDTENNGNFDIDNFNVEFTEDVTAGTTETLTVTAVDADGNVRVDSSGESATIESNSEGISTVEQRDSNNDGDIDTAVVTFDEAVDDSTIDVGDYQFDNDNKAATGMDTTIDGSTANDNVVAFTLDDDNEIDGTDTVEFGYSGDGTGDTTDLAGNALNDDSVPAGTVTDAAGPVLLSAATSDSGDTGGSEIGTDGTSDTDGATANNGQIDTYTLTFSESVDDSTLSEDQWSLGGGYSIDTFTTGSVSGSDETIVIDIVESGTSDTGTTPDITTSGATLEDDENEENVIVGVGSSDVSETDAATPQITDAELKDTGNTAGEIDRADVTFSETIDFDTVEAGDYTIDGNQVDSVADSSGGSSDDSVIRLNLDDGNEVDSTDDVNVKYDADNSASSKTADDASSPNLVTEDLTGNNDISTTDSADVIVDSVSKGTGEVTVTFSEDVGPGGTVGTKMDEADFSYTDADASVGVTTTTESDAGTPSIAIQLSGDPGSGDEITLVTTIGGDDGSTVSSPITVP